MTRRISASEFKKSGIVNNKKQASEEVVQADEKRTLPYWMEKLQKVLSHHQAERQQMDGRERLYRGTKQIDGRLPGTVARKPATVTRNIVFELIESQIDANIPQPKVSALCADCEEKALAVENFLKAELQRLPMERLNDEQERTVPLQGGSWFLLEWDSKAPEGQALCVSILHPKDVLVQPGVVEIDEADYVFVLRRRTREQLFRQYGVWVAESNALKSYEGGQTDMITHVTVYYKDNSGRIGLFAFAGDEVLQDLPDYLKRACFWTGKRRTA